MQLESLSFYLKSAEKVIQKYGPAHLTRDEDAISHVANAMMKADVNFNGNGTITGYRVYCGQMAIKYIIDRYNKKKAKGYNVYSLDYDIEENGGGLSYDNVPDDRVSEQETYENFSEWLEGPGLSEKQRLVVERYYYYNDTYEDIGRLCGFSKQRAEQIMSDAHKILREYYGD